VPQLERHRMSRKSTAYGRRRARLISAGHVLEKDGITMTQVNNTRLSPLDAAWLFTEARATPNHVGGLLQFKLPPRAPSVTARQCMAKGPPLA
jgi:hypothetical protein